MKKISKRAVVLGSLGVALLATAVLAAQNIQGVQFPGNGTIRLPWADTGNGTQANHTTLYAAADGSLHLKPHGGTDIQIGAGGGGTIDGSGTAAYIAVWSDADTLTSLGPTTDNAVPIGNGSAFVLESGSTLRASLGLAIGTNVQAWDEELDDVAGVSPTADNFLGGTGTALAMRTPAQVRTSLGLAASGDGSGDITAITETGDALSISGGTGPTPDISANAKLEAIADATMTDNLVLAADGTTPVTQTLTSLIDEAIGSTRGSFLERGASGWALLTPGTVDLPLVSNGSGADPAYEVLAVAGGGTGATDSATARSNLGLAIGTNVQAFDSDLSELAAISGSRGDIIFHNGTDWVRLAPAGTDGFVLSSEGSDEDPVWIAPSAGTITLVQETGNSIVVSGGTGPTVTLSASELLEDIASITSADADQFLGFTGTSAILNRTPAQVRTSLGLVIGTNVQAWDEELDDIAGLTPTADNFVGGTGSALAMRTPSQVRTSLGLVIGTNVQAWDDDLDDLAAISGVRGDIIFYGASGWTRLAAAGTDGFVLSSEGSDEDPVWVSPGAGGDLTEITESGDGIIVSNGAGPVVDLSLQARLDDIASITTWATNDIIMAAGETSLINVGPATARTNLGLAIGTDVQAFDEELSDIAGLSPTDNNVIIGNGSAFVLESGATLRTSIGLAIGTNVQAWDEELDDVAGVTPSADQFLGGTGSALAMRTAAQVRTSLNVGDGADITEIQETGNGIIVASGTGPIPSLSVQGHLEDIASITTADADQFLGFTGETALVNRTAAQVRTSLGLVIGTNVQAWDEELDDIAGLSPTDNNVIIGNGSAFVLESGATLRTSIGLAIGTNVQAWDEELDDVAGVTPSADQFLGGTGSALAMRTAAQVRTSLNVGDGADITEIQETGNGITVASGTGPIPSLSVADLLEDIASITSADADQFLGFTGTTAILNRTPAQVRTSLGLVIGTNVQAFDDELTDVAGLTPGDGEFIVGDGAAFITESGATARASLGLTIGTHVQAFDAQLTDFAALAPTKGRLAVADGTNWLPLTVGTDTHVLTADSAEALGVKWAAAAAGSGDLTSITETGDAIIIANGTGPDPDISAHTNLEEIADIVVTRGDLIVVDASSNFVDLAVGAAGTVLIGGTDPSYSATPTVTSVRVGAGSAAAPSVLLNDTDVGIYSGGADILGFSTAGTRRGIFEDGGSLILAAADPAIYGSGLSSMPLLVSRDGGTSYMMNHSYSTDADAAGAYYFMRGRGTGASPTGASSGDLLGTIIWTGVHSSNNGDSVVARINVRATETVTSSASGGYLGILTTPNSSTTPVERARFTTLGIDVGDHSIMWGSAIGTNEMSLTRSADRVWEFGDETPETAGSTKDVTLQAVGRADMTIQGGAADTTNNAGAFVARGGAGGTSGDGATASLIGGTSGSTAGETGGLAIVQGGAVHGTDNNGGGVQILGVNGGSDASPRSGGSILIDAGDGGTGAAGAGGNVTISAGGASSTGDGGTITISAGNSASGADGPILFNVAGAEAGSFTASGFLRSNNGVIVNTVDANGWRLVDSGTSFQFLDGDGTDLDINDSIDLGTTSGFPRIYAANYGGQPTYSHIGDTNTGWGCLEADAPGQMSEGKFKQFISNKVALTDATNTNFVTLPLAADNSMAGHLRWTIHHGSTSIDNYAVKTGSLIFLAQDDSGVLTSSFQEDANELNLGGAGGYTMAETFSIVDGTNAITLRVSADTSAPSTTADRFFIEFECWVSTSDTANTIPTIP